ncbi:hypothetical protein BKA64DRAFT_383232 [Cadophora sp. MPI-SDFR-AT-0126]|nr:hypothetical protein BKA64DRAFT_383232 [Leotiomycetes sp. MPI-SDFR-AT-0126]
MKLFSLPFSVLFILVTAAAAAAATAAAKNETVPIGKPHPCALNCSIASLTATRCDSSDFRNCLCLNSTLQAQLSICVQRTCSFGDQLVAAETGQQLCAGYPQESRSATLRNLTIVLFSITIVFLILRPVSRWIVFGQLWIDDWVSIFATLVHITGTVLQLIACEKGLGKHYWNINPKEGPTLIKIFHALELLYTTVKVSSRIAVLLLYIRIFPMERFHRICKGFIVFLITGGVAFTFVLLFQCWPLTSLWDRSIPGRCVNITAVGYAGAGLSIFDDLAIFALPLPWLNTLQINLCKKISIMLLFSLGSFACVTSMVRLKYLITLRHSYDPTYTKNSSRLIQLKQKEEKNSLQMFECH